MLPALDPSALAIADWRTHELVKRLPDCSILRLSADGLPDVLMDMYFGVDGPESLADLRELAESFQFDSGDNDAAKGRTAEEAGGLPDWRTIILPSVTMPEGEARMTLYDLNEDMSIAFRPARMNLGCDLAWPVRFDGFRPTGDRLLLYGPADAGTAVVQARRKDNANPNLGLSVWNGLDYVRRGNSSRGDYMDTVFWESSSCTPMNVRIELTMSTGGFISFYIFTFDANSN